MKCPSCGKSLWFIRNFCPFCKRNISAAPRPKSVAIICDIFIVGSCLVLLMFFISDRSELYLPERSGHAVRYAYFLFVPISYIIFSGFSFLGHNWARWGLVGCLVSNVLVTLVRHWQTSFLIARILAVAVVGYYLFRSQARPFFMGESTLVPNSKEETTN